MTQNMPYQVFKTAIANKLIDEGIYDRIWFESQESRLSMFWNAGETPDSAYQVIGEIANAKFSPHVYRETTFASLAACGCEFQRV